MGQKSQFQSQFIGKAAVRQRPPINRQAKRPNALTGFQTGDIRKCDEYSEKERGRERERGLGGARRTCPFSLARGYRHGNWKRHFGRHHNLKLKCAASGEGRKAVAGEGEATGGGGEANHKPISIPAALGSSFPPPFEFIP